MPTSALRHYKIHGMDCAEEVAVLKRELEPLTGMTNELVFDVLKGRMSVPDAVSASSVLKAVATTRMRAELWSEDSTTPSVSTTDSKKLYLTCFSISCLTLGFIFHVATQGLSAALGDESKPLRISVPLLSSILYILSSFSGVVLVLPKAWYSIRRTRPDMNLLMVAAVIGAISIGERLEAATVSFLFATSLLLESWSVGRARRAVESLLKLTPETVRVIQVDKTELEQTPALVPIGSEFLVRPGERIGLDGNVVEGASEVNQASITGESVPVLKEAGAAVFAGTINGDGLLRIRSTHTASDTTIARIIKMVGDAQSKRAPSEQWVEKFSIYYTPIILLLAIAVALVPPLLFSQAWSDWIYRALVLLVIGCPCALVISTPVSIVAAISAAARNGVLLKNGAIVEIPASIQAIALDKTGTLTMGKPKVSDVISLNGSTEQQLLLIAVALESHSTHPIAHAIIEHAQSKNISVASVEEYQAVQGRGVNARLGGVKYWLGSHKYLEERKQETESVHLALESLSNEGKTLVIVGDESHVLGYIATQDAIRPEAIIAINKLHSIGVRPIVMLTGDNKNAANTVGASTGVDRVVAELLPENKVGAIEELLKEHQSVAMIGDGVNDAPALARSTLGIAMGAIGSDAAIEAADVALMSDDLGKVPWLIEHSRRTLTIIRQNIFFALATKASFLALSVSGHATLWMAVIADTGVSLIVIANAMRLFGNQKLGK